MAFAADSIRALALLTLGACSGQRTPDSRAPDPTDADTDADSDADGDTDSDVDSDADGDTGFDPGALSVLRGQDALAGAAPTVVQGFGGSGCGDWVSVDGQGGVVVHCDNPTGSSTDGLLHLVDGPALLEGRPDVLATLSGVFVGSGQAGGGMGDLDGDTLRDLGLRSGAGSGTDLGWVVPGSAWAGDAALGDVGWSLVGQSGSVGLAPQIVDDIDGDGTSDLIIAQEPDSYSDDNSIGTRLIVVSGASLFGTGSPATVQVLTLPGYELTATRGMGAPRVIGGVGDVDGDGLADIGVAFGPRDEPGPDQAGDVRIVLSSTLGEVTLDDCPSITGVLVGRLLTSEFAPLGDLDGDGKGELAIGFVKDDATGSVSRHLEFGVVPGAQISAATRTVITPWAADLQGYTGVACDLDGDGLPEWVSADGIWAGALLLGTNPAAIATGVDAIACLGDLDADGVEEIAM